MVWLYTEIQITWSFSLCCYVSEINIPYHIENYNILFLLISSFMSYGWKKNHKENFFYSKLKYIFQTSLDRDPMLTLNLWSQIFLFWTPLWAWGIEACTNDTKSYVLCKFQRNHKKIVFSENDFKVFCNLYSGFFSIVM